MINHWQEYPSGLIPFKLKEREKNMKELRNLRMMRLQEENLMLKKKFINKSRDRSNSIKLKKCFMIIRIW
jgi:hypothetical protein